MRLAVPLLLVAALATGCGDASPSTSTPTSPPSTSSPSTSSPSTSTPDAGAVELPWPAPLAGDHQRWTVEIVERLPHDPAAFTQGLEFGVDGLWESVGITGQSAIRLTDPATGAVLAQRPLAAEHFGEGLTMVGDTLIQLTWQAGVAYRYASDLTPVEPLTYEGDGWGLCHDGVDLWMTDGSATLTRRGPDLEHLDAITVTRDGESVPSLNELECIGDHVVANIWKSDDVVVIDPETAMVVATIDAAALRAEVAPVDERAVLNGIADPGDGTLVLTGKLWPTTYVVRVVAADGG